MYIYTKTFFLLLGLTLMLGAYQNCSAVSFGETPASSVAAASVTPSISPTPAPEGPAPSCKLTSSNTNIVSVLPTGVTPAQIAAISPSPSIGCDTEVGVVIIVSDSGISLYFTGQGPYDGSDDTLVGVLNISSNPVSTINLSSNLDIMGFDNDGIDTYYIGGGSSRGGGGKGGFGGGGGGGACVGGGSAGSSIGTLVPGNSTDTSGYGGPNSYFTNISANNTSGTVNFIVPVAAGGGTTYFSLENALTTTSTCLTTVAN
jgi:hypothetical protein